MFYNGPSNTSSKITVNYTANASSLIDQMIATNTGGLVVKGVRVD